MTHWTTPADLKDRARRWWRSGALLRAVLPGERWEAQRVKLKMPTSKELADRFPEARKWIETLHRAAPAGYRLEQRTFRHPTLGENTVPSHAYFDDAAGVARWLGHAKDLRRFTARASEAAEAFPALEAFCRDHPHDVLKHADVWPQLLAVCRWRVANDRPNIYLRQVELPGIDTKFIEGHHAVLARMLDRVLPVDSVEASSTGRPGFAHRYGFTRKPRRIRLRPLDPVRPGLVDGVPGEVTVTEEAFATLETAPGFPEGPVFVTENEINFLTFPPVSGGIILFGAGYDFDLLRRAGWLRRRRIAYWGDLDTHGFAMLDQFRSVFPETDSLLMDEATLLEHRFAWGEEPKPTSGDRPRLHTAERKLYEDLIDGRWRERIRLEQEYVGFARVREAVVAWVGGG